MIFVDNLGGWFPPINHSDWNYVTLADFVMPFFLFMVSAWPACKSDSCCRRTHVLTWLATGTQAIAAHQPLSCRLLMTSPCRLGAPCLCRSRSTRRACFGRLSSARQSCLSLVSALAICKRQRHTAPLAVAHSLLLNIIRSPPPHHCIAALATRDGSHIPILCNSSMPTQSFTQSFTQSGPPVTHTLAPHLLSHTCCQDW
jgi:hypothetical protein